MNLRETLREDFRAWTDRTGTPLHRWYLLILPLNAALTALVILRLGQWLTSRKMRVLARFCYALNIYLTGCDIRPEAEIGPGLFMGHPNGECIGIVKIGRNAIIAPRVAIGSRGGWGTDGLPNIGNNVTIYLNSSILGPITVGDDSVIAGHSMVIGNVPPGSMVAGVPARIIRNLTSEEIRRQRRPNERDRPLPATPVSTSNQTFQSAQDEK
jgi:serine O-acetyltransferase